MAKGKFGYCEFCLRRNIPGAADTVCKQCHEELEAEQGLEAMQRAIAWGKKYPCRTCKGPCEEGRTRVCKQCLPELPEDTTGTTNFIATLNEGSRWNSVRVSAK